MLLLTLKTGEAIALNASHIIGVRQLKSGCEIQVITGLIYEVDDKWRDVASEMLDVLREQKIPAL